MWAVYLLHDVQLRSVCGAKSLCGGAWATRHSRGLQKQTRSGSRPSMHAPPGRSLCSRALAVHEYECCILCQRKVGWCECAGEARRVTRRNGSAWRVRAARHRARFRRTRNVSGSCAAVSPCILQFDFVHHDHHHKWDQVNRQNRLAGRGIVLVDFRLVPQGVGRSRERHLRYRRKTDATLDCLVVMHTRLTSYGRGRETRWGRGRGQPRARELASQACGTSPQRKARTHGHEVVGC